MSGKRIGMLPMVLACCAWPFATSAQVPDSVRTRALAGCWATSVGHFSATADTGRDGGMTNVPALVRLDTLPGLDYFNRPLFWSLAAIPDSAASRYRKGWYAAFPPDSVQLHWSTGHMWLVIRAVTRGRELRGVAWVGTDAGGDREASIVLRRVSCP